MDAKRTKGNPEEQKGSDSAGEFENAGFAGDEEEKAELHSEMVDGRIFWNGIRERRVTITMKVRRMRSFGIQERTRELCDVGFTSAC